MNKSLKIVSKSAQAPNCFLFPNICGSLSNTVKVPYGSKRRFPSNYVGGSIIENRATILLKINWLYKGFFCLYF